MPDDLVARAIAAGSEEDRLALIRSMTSAELHAFVAEYNWDDGFAPMREVVRSSRCELATALLAFWLADPDLSMVPPRPGRDPQHTAFVAELYAAIVNGRYARGSLPFNPDEFIVNHLQRVQFERAGLPAVFMAPL